MSTLIIHRHGTTQRRCDANCHTAKGPRCTCVCGGLCHGLGTQRAPEALYQLLMTTPHAFHNCEIPALQLTPEFQWDFPAPPPPPPLEDVLHA